MSRKRTLFLTTLILAASAWTPLAQAGRFNDRGRHDHHHRSADYGHRDSSGAALGAGLLLGASLVWLGSYSPPAPPRRVVVVSSPPPVILAPPVQRLPPPPQDVWYYCRSEGAYYPYVQGCRTPWEIVPVQ